MLEEGRPNVRLHSRAEGMSPVNHGELKDIAEQVRQELEINKKIFGTPAFKHTSAFRGIEGTWTGEEWFIQARSLDISHRVSDDVIDRLMTDIRQNPPKPKTGTIEVDPTDTEVK